MAVSVRRRRIGDGANGHGPSRSQRAPQRAPRASTRADRALVALRRGFERYLARALRPSSTVPRRLHAAIRYSALSPGKRLRPLLVLTACEAVGGSPSRALPAAAAVECVHAFSLVHDDLPAMDDDDFRRGRLTTHKRFGEALGVLAGDALLAQAFAERLEALGVPAERVSEAVRVLARAAGSEQLVGGQALDLEAEGRPATGPAVRAIHARKTGALMAASLVLGGLAGGATRAQLRTLERIGRELGLAFQIHDDLLNLGSSLSRLGKRAGTDAARGKATYPRAVGEEQARLEAAALIRSALGRVLGLGPRAAHLAHLVLATAERER
jgi:geranylgeranyl diphosphate synthase type II